MAWKEEPKRFNKKDYTKGSLLEWKRNIMCTRLLTYLPPLIMRPK